MAHFDSVLDAYVEAAKAPNHAVREAASNCIRELAARVAGSPQQPTAYRKEFTAERVSGNSATAGQAWSNIFKKSM